jgi:hypothetical protein
LVGHDKNPKYIASVENDFLYYEKFISGDTTGLSFDEFKPVEHFKQIIRVDINTGDLFKYDVHTAGMNRMRRLGKGTESGGLTAPTTIWGVDKEGNLFTCNTLDYMISKYDTANQEIMRFCRKYEQKRYRHHKKRPGSSEYEPFLADRMMFFDEKGNLWVEIQTRGYSRTYKYDVFSPYGIYIKQVTVPCRIYHLKKDKIYTRYRDHDLDKRIIKRYKILNPIT